MNKCKISASMMCANLIDLKSTLDIFEKNEIDYLHIDVMDGTFVPNFGLGSDYIRELRELTKIPLDLHLMIDKPEYKLQCLDIQKTDIVSIHYESTNQIHRALEYLKKQECKCFLAINPTTSIQCIEEVLGYIDGINLLTVNPGFAGQKIVPSTIEKAYKLKEFLKNNNAEHLAIEVDGNITPENGRKLRKCGANIFVAGTSSIFKGKVKNYPERIEDFRKIVECNMKN